MLRITPHIWHYLFFGAVLCLIPSESWAQLLTCDGFGGVSGQSGMFDVSDTGTCQARGIDHVFSTVLCDFALILNDTLSRLYCSMQYFLIETLRLVITVYICVFGWQLLMGTAQLNMRDVMMRLIKISLVWVFATQSAYGIDVMWGTVLAVMGDASGWVVNAIAVHLNVAGCNTIQFAYTDFSTFFLFLDCLVWMTVAGPTQIVSIKLLGLMVALAFAYPPLTGLALWWLTKTFMTLTRAVISLLMAVAATAFLISLAPIFLSLALFNTTAEHFNNWLRYIISYIIQIVMTFAIVVCWIIVFLQFTFFFEELSNLVFASEPVLDRVSDVTPTNSWSICPAEYYEVGGIRHAECESGFWPYPDRRSDGSFNMDWTEDAEDLIMPSKMILNGEFLYYVFFHLVSLMIVTYAFSVMLDNAPLISQSIAQPAHLPTMLRRFGNDGFGSAGDLLSPLSNRRKIFSGGAPQGGAGQPIGRAAGGR